jgi:hypothetical protein
VPSPNLQVTRFQCFFRHSGEGRNPVTRFWTPAFAGVTGPCYLKDINSERAWKLKTDIIAFPLIEEKTGFGFFVYMKKVAPVARTVSRHGRNENATLATIFHNHKVHGIKNNLVPI